MFVFSHNNENPPLLSLVLLVCLELCHLLSNSHVLYWYIFEHTPKEVVVPKNLFNMFHIDEFISLNIMRIRLSWEYLSGSVLAASVKVPYFWDWMINLMNDSNRNLFTPHSNQHLLSFISLSCLYNEWPQFFFEIGRRWDWGFGGSFLTFPRGPAPGWA